MDVDHLHGGELFQHTARGQPGCEGVEPALECHLQTVSQERDEDMSLDPTFVLMEDRTDCEVALQVFECSTATSWI
jgi:hypothetical protein